MVHDILLIGSIYDYQIEYFFDQIKEAYESDPNAEFNIRINGRGGNPECGMSIIRKMIEIKDQASITVDGAAHSMLAFTLCYVDNVDASDTAQFLLHRAAYGEWYESRPDFQGSAMADSLTMTNKDLEKAFRARVDVEAFEALPKVKDKGITVKSMFSMEGRQEVVLNAAEAKKIGLIKTITKITPTKAAQIQAYAEAFKGCDSPDLMRKAAESIKQSEKIDEPKIENTPMTLDELKAKHPDVYAQAVAAGVLQGTEAERDRIGAAMVYADVDPKGVAAIVASGKPMTQTQAAEFGRKAIAAEAIKKVEGSNPGAIETTETTTTAKTEKDKSLEAFTAEVDANVGLKKTA